MKEYIIKEFAMDDERLKNLGCKPPPPASLGTPPQKGGEFIRNMKINNVVKHKLIRKKLRNNLTPAEAKFWSLVSNKKFNGMKFRRQHGISNYILDFYCPEKLIAVELDGSVHFTEEGIQNDKSRDDFLSRIGIKVFRFENRIVFENPEYIFEKILKYLETKNSPPVKEEYLRSRGGGKI